jgi:hypothetical protein
MKCSFCKMNYNENNLNKIIVSNKKGYFTICKVCEKKNDLKQLVENKKDALYINQLKYRLNKIGLEANNEFLDLCKLNAKLKRELCNNS